MHYAMINEKRRQTFLHCQNDCYRGVIRKSRYLFFLNGSFVSVTLSTFQIYCLLPQGLTFVSTGDGLPEVPEPYE